MHGAQLCASQSGTEQYKRLSQQKTQAQADAAAEPNGQFNAPRRSRDGRQSQGLHNIMSGLQSVREEDSAEANESPLAGAHAANGLTPGYIDPAPAAQVAMPQAAAANGGAQFIVGDQSRGSANGGSQDGAQPSTQLPPTRAKPIKVPSRGKSQGYPYGMSRNSSPMPVLQSPFAAAAAAPL